MSVPTITTSFERYFIDFSGTYNELDGSSTIIEAYAIKKKSDPAGPVIAPGAVIGWDSSDYALMVTEGVIPVVGQDRLSWNAPTYPPCDFPQETMRCRSVDIQSMKTGDIRVVINWQTMYSVKPSSVGTATVVWELPSSTEWQGATRTMKAWRRTWATNPPPTSDSTAGDIAGFNYNGKIEGVDIQVPQIRVRMKFTLDASVTPMITQYQQVVDYIGKINSDVFLDFPVGSLVCEGITMGKVQHEYYELIFEFLFDSFYHHSQVPKTEFDGQIEEDSLGNAKTVKWERQTRATAPFNNIWAGNTELQALVENGYWT